MKKEKINLSINKTSMTKKRRFQRRSRRRLASS